MINGHTKQEGKITVFYLKDDLTANRVKSFLKKVDEIIGLGNRHIVLELSQVEEISLMGMIGISSMFNRLRTTGGALKVAGLTPFVRRSFRQTNLINTVEVYEEALDAVKSFKSHNLLKSKTYSGSFYMKETNSFVAWDRLPVTGLIQ